MLINSKALRAGLIGIFCWFGLSVGAHAQTTTVRVGAYENTPKVQIGENGKISGIFGDLLYEIAEREGWEIQVVPCRWSDCLTLLAAGQIDLMPDVALTESRNQELVFNELPVLYSWSQLYSKDAKVLKTLLELDGLRVAVLRDSVQENYLNTIALNFGIHVELVPVGTFDEGFAAVLGKRADVVAVNHFYGDKRSRELGFEATPVMFQPSRLFFAAAPNPEAAQLVGRIDRWLADWREASDSPYQEVMKNWGVYAPDQEEALSKWLLPGLLAVLLLAILSVAALRHQVKKKSRALLESEQRSNTILNSVEAFIFIKDEQLKYRYANKKVCELVGETEQSIIGKSDFDVFETKTAEHLRERDLRVIKFGERVVDEESSRTIKGEQRQFLSVKIPLRDADERIYGLCGIATDITEHIEIQEQLNQLAYYDSVTGLANRKLVMQQLEHAVASYRRTGYEGAVLAIDLIDFTLINDTLGHAFGDKLLATIAERLEAIIDETDCAARLGSDDFVLVLEDLGPDRNEAILSARRLATEVVRLIEQPVDLGSRFHTTAACIGISMFSDSDNGAAELIKNADLALTEAKALGSGSVRLFNPEMQQSISRRLHLEDALRSAIEESALQLYLQPQVDVNGVVTGGELLLRWQDEEFGQVPPAEFIPVAESSGLIVPLGNWVIEQACQLLQKWSADGQLSKLQLAINISPRQFRQATFVEYVESCMARHQVPHGKLELEITENMLIDNIDMTVKRMSKLGEIGVRFSLDDFGTGYASLAYLKRLPIYQLKIDQSFVRDVLTDMNDAVIIETIVGLGQSLRLEVVAEGVETAAQAEALRDLGCEKFQGFYFGRPQPVDYWVDQLSTSLQVAKSTDE
ncbi:EAL domain-containing protein [Pseudidiomarina terrestris]|uniref:cyclic-guanylate-specific phosphodiesterase n=1 Tax=Pseudidiomarina terrestris TaxID=2820060 RepID=A0AAW7R221_9GAMM|nr:MULTISPECIES: EAL domain-containing protein [unclassified Pseudidiomarina]MDN7125319.1 EAL domain-containing protein [Pseudidiomarina sp. 1APP75-32.1]MDN7130078.1 EAL domain-containing protein [Pseudidiomarina sp. 1APR75-15]MDN7135583.1 EAL domain-containing protein [Pseudidiomarina sp. 1ASP75-5]MEA3589093.1 EAL domain-containing protein [Pseudidiomarina sp. 1APP75-27a]